MFFTVDELDLSTWGIVEAINDYPPIADGEGKVVISRFKTLQAEEMTRITLADGSEIIGTTVHPVWSVDAEDWVPLAELVPGERLQTRSGEIEIVSVVTFAYRQSVYNFEVHTEHVYEIGELGVLVHSAEPSKYDSKVLRNALQGVRRASDSYTQIRPGTKAWKEAVAQLSKMGKEKANFRVKTATEAKQLLLEARGKMNRYKQYTRDGRGPNRNYPKGYEAHNVQNLQELAVGNDLRHLKWFDGKSSGHIFYDIPN